MLTPEELSQRLLQSGLSTPSNLQGCTDDELEHIERANGCTLPTEYKKVMKVLGKGAGTFCSDVDMFYPSVITLTQRMRTVIAESGKQLPQDAFVFADRDGDQTLFFYLKDDHSSPPIFRWDCEKPKKFQRLFSSIWVFIEDQLQYHESIIRRKSKKRDQ